MELAFQILIPVAVFVVLGALMSTMLAIASRAFAVKTDERVEAIAEILPGANCGGCGYAGCHALAEAIVRGDAKTSACAAGGEETAKKIAAIMGTEDASSVRMRAQVMCSGTDGCAKKKYIYEGEQDCIAGIQARRKEISSARTAASGSATCAKKLPL